MKTIEQVLSSIYIIPEDLINAFDSLEKTNLLIKNLSTLNHIYPISDQIKGSDMSAIIDIDRYFYSNKETKLLPTNVSNSKLFRINNIPLYVEKFPNEKLQHLSFKVVPSNLNSDHTYKVYSPITSNIFNAQFHVLSSPLLNHTYISYILHLISKTYNTPPPMRTLLTFFNKSDGFALKESYNLNLEDYIHQLKTIDIDIINNIFSQILFQLLPYKTTTYEFSHNNLILENIFVQTTNNNIIIKIGNFSHSSIFFNGVKFFNQNSSNTDIHILALSILLQPRIYNYFSANNQAYLEIYSMLFTGDDPLSIALEISPWINLLNKISSLSNLSNSPTLMSNLNNNINLNLIPNSLIKEYFQMKKRITPQQILSKYNYIHDVDSFYDKFIQTNPTISYDTYAPTLPLYDTYENLSFLLTKNNNLCLNECISTCITPNNLDHCIPVKSIIQPSESFLLEKILEKNPPQFIPHFFSGTSNLSIGSTPQTIPTKSLSLKLNPSSINSFIDNLQIQNLNKKFTTTTSLKQILNQSIPLTLQIQTIDHPMQVPLNTYISTPNLCETIVSNNNIYVIVPNASPLINNLSQLELTPILIQIAYTVELIPSICVDPKNILIEKLPNSISIGFIIKEKSIVLIKTKYLVKIIPSNKKYDFNQLINNIKPQIIPNSNPLIWLKSLSMPLNSTLIEKNTKIFSLEPITKENDQLKKMFFSLCSHLHRTITIDWVRHAESCANLYQGTQMDKNIYPQRPIGYDYYQNRTSDSNDSKIQSQPILTKTLNKITASWKYEPNLSYIGMQHAIKLGIDYVQSESYDVIICSALTRTITTAILANRHNPNLTIYVVPYISEIQNKMQLIQADHQNTGVNSSILKKRVAFIKDWLEKNWIDNFDDIEVMTDLIQIEKSSDQSPIYEKIRKSILCKPKKIISKENSICSSITSIISELLDHMIQTNQTENFFYKKYSKILPSINNFKRGPIVNFDILELYEQIYLMKLKNSDPDAQSYNPKNTSIKLFYTEILPLINGTKILAIAHGSLIRKIFSQKDPQTYELLKGHLAHLKNTQIIREEINYQTSKFIEQFDPTLIRSTYDNFEILNTDVCQLESIKGIINFNLLESSIPLSDNKVTSDVKFYSPKSYANLPKNLA